MSDRDKIIDKIKKCLALSASSNEHEAEAALRQAMKLMELHGITELDVLAAEAVEAAAKAGASMKPANWEAMLAAKIGDAFGCRVLFSCNYGRPGNWLFIGLDPAPEIAQYAFSTLLRQAKSARQAHIKGPLKRCKPATKTRRADLFSDGWVHSVTGKINTFAGTPEHDKAVSAFLAKKYPDRGSLKSRNRNAGRRLSDLEHGDYFSGRSQGKDAQLNHGVNGAPERQALGKL